MKNLREQRNAIAEWYGALRHSSDSAWDNVKNGFVGAYRKLTDAFDKAENQFGRTPCHRICRSGTRERCGAQPAPHRCH